MADMTIQQIFDLALQRHHAGQLPDAERLYRQVLAQQPAHADALHHLGMLAQQVGQSEIAVDLIRRALSIRPNYPEAFGNLGVALKSIGHVDEATAAFRRAIALSPNYPEAHNNLGVALRDAGQLDEAIAACRQAIALRANYADAHGNLANALKAKGLLDEAISEYRFVTALAPKFAEGHNNLGIALGNKGQFDEAISEFRQAIALRPGYAEAHGNLGVALKDRGRLDEATAAFRQAVMLRPNFPEAYSNLGNALREQGLLDEAIAACRQAAALNPDYADAHNNLGIALGCSGRLDEAVAEFRWVVSRHPRSPEAHNNLANTLSNQGRLDEAIAECQTALSIYPEFADAYTNLGNALKHQNELEQAIAAYRRAIVLKPELAEAHSNLGVALRNTGRLNEAIDAFAQARRLKPDFLEAHSNLLSTLQYCADITPAALAEAHAEFDRQHAAPLRKLIKPHDNDRNPNRRLRVGLVSPDLCRHPVGQFLLGLLTHIDPRQQEIFCYHDRFDKDDVTERLAESSHAWRDVIGFADDRLAQQIRDDRIDILFDLAGHTAHNRLLVFARKPAPLQVTWLGYVGSTGVRAIDYLLADRHLVPSEAASPECEKVLHLPDGYVCYSPPTDAPAVVLPPAATRDYVTFGCFNNLSKITPEVIDVWAKILRRTPKSRLVMRYSGLNDPAVRQRLVALFAERGVAGDSLDLFGWSSYATRMDLYNQIDIALDPFPYSGATTTCDALWMGVPVITCPGETFASRQSLTHLRNVGLNELVASDLADYVERAVDLAGDVDRLAIMRANLRERMSKSPLMDAPKFAQNFQAVCREIWREWRHKPSAALAAS